MRPTARRLAFAALLACAALPPTACGGASEGYHCVDVEGYSVPCGTPGSITVSKAGRPHLAFPMSANGAGVYDASDELVTFFAQAPHAAEVRGMLVGELVLDSNGRLQWRGMPAGWVVYAECRAGDRVAVLVDDVGRLLDVEVGPGGLALRATDVPVRLLAAGEVPIGPEVRALTSLPVAIPEAPPAPPAAGK
jgi:hypothetical protein